MQPLCRLHRLCTPSVVALSCLGPRGLEHHLHPPHSHTLSPSLPHRHSLGRRHASSRLSLFQFPSSSPPLLVPPNPFVTEADIQTCTSPDDYISSAKSLIKILCASRLPRLDQLQRLVCLLKENPDVSSLVWQDGLIPVLVELLESDQKEVEQLARLILSLVGYAPPHRGHGLRILSLDGGGTR